MSGRDLLHYVVPPQRLERHPLLEVRRVLPPSSRRHPGASQWLWNLWNTPYPAIRNAGPPQSPAVMGEHQVTLRSSSEHFVHSTNPPYERCSVTARLFFGLTLNLLSRLVLFPSSLLEPGVQPDVPYLAHTARPATMVTLIRLAALAGRITFSCHRSFVPLAIVTAANVLGIITMSDQGATSRKRPDSLTFPEHA